MNEERQMFFIDRSVATLSESQVTVDEGSSIDWDDVAVTTVGADDQLDAESLVDTFGTNEFYQLPAVVARPVLQNYTIDGEERTFLKPPEELQKVAWYIDGTPWTLEHPSTRMLSQTDDVRGFWRDGEYDSEEDALTSTLYIPTIDTEAQRFVEENPALSIGFYSDVVPAEDYLASIDDGERELDIDANVSEVDAFQTDLLLNHISSVSHGRCSEEQGCGLSASVDSSNNSGVNDAGITTLIEAGAEPNESTTKSKTNTNTTTNTTTMCEEGLIDVDDLTLDAVADQNSAVASVIDEAEELRSEVEELRDTADTATDKAEALEEKNEELRASLDEYERAEKEPLADDIIEHSGRFTEDAKEDLMARDTDHLTEIHEIVMDVASTETTVEDGVTDSGGNGNGDGNGSSGGSYEEPLTMTPWDD